MAHHIENLKKVTLALKVIDGKGNDLVAGVKSFSFVYGSASEGLCPLEIALSEKSTGDAIRIQFVRSEMREICGHLLQPLLGALGLQIMPDQFGLDITIADVADAETREIIQAVAQSVGSCHGEEDCGCGCC